MTKKIDDILSESVGLSEDLRSQLTGLWEFKITEAREEISATLREEFARKFQHDKGVLVESMDRFLTDKVRAELEEFAIDRQQLIAERQKLFRWTKDAHLSEEIVQSVQTAILPLVRELLPFRGHTHGVLLKRA